MKALTIKQLREILSNPDLNDEGTVGCTVAGITPATSVTFATVISGHLVFDVHPEGEEIADIDYAQLW